MPDAVLLSPRAARTRAALLAAGLDLLAVRPIDAISIDELVAAAGVAKGSFFNHFGDKDGFTAAVAGEIHRAMGQRVARINGGISDPIERLGAGMVAAAGFAFSEPQRTRALGRISKGLTLADHPLNAGIRDNLRAAIAQGLIRPEAERTGVLFWLGCCHMLMGAIIERQPSFEAATALVGDMLVMALNGLGVEAETMARLTTRVTESGWLTRGLRITSASDPAPASEAKA